MEGVAVKKRKKATNGPKSVASAKLKGKAKPVIPHATTAEIKPNAETEQLGKILDSVKKETTNKAPSLANAIKPSPVTGLNHITAKQTQNLNASSTVKVPSIDTSISTVPVPGPIPIPYPNIGRQNNNTGKKEHVTPQQVDEKVNKRSADKQVNNRIPITASTVANANAINKVTPTTAVPIANERTSQEAEDKSVQGIDITEPTTIPIVIQSRTLAPKPEPVNSAATEIARETEKLVTPEPSSQAANTESATTTTSETKAEVEAEQAHTESIAEQVVPASTAVSEREEPEAENTDVSSVRFDPATEQAPITNENSQEQTATPLNTETGETTKDTESSESDSMGIDFGGGGGGGAGADVQDVKPMALDGPSEGMVENFATSSASQIAASQGALGEAVTKQLGTETEQAAKEMPPLEAKAAGVEEDPDGKMDKGQVGAAEIQDGKTEADSPIPKPGAHQDLGPKPNNSKNVDKIKEDDSGGFWSWLKGAMSGFLGGVSTRDNGVNTKVGDKPAVALSGSSDPNRLGNQRTDGDTQMADEKAKTSNALKNHPGQQNIQAKKVDEKVAVNITKAAPTAVETAEQKDMLEFVSMPLPGSVREVADKNMAPALEKSMSKPRADVKTASQKRDTDKKDVTEKAQKDAAALGDQANKEQDDAVLKSRKDVAAQQEDGVKEAQGKMDAFNKETDAEQEVANKAVKDRVTMDQTDVDTKMKQAETDAAKEKEKGDAKAAKKKADMEKDSKNDSWWDKVKGAVKSVVSALTKAIDFIFTAVRDAVKFVIDKAKEAALAVIEAGRKWITEKLDQFGSWLKSKVSEYLSAFPALAEKINAAIDATVNAAKKAVNAVADKLKAGVEALANAVAGFIDGILSKFQAGLKAAVAIVGAVLTGDFAEAAKIAFYAICEIAGIDPKPIMDFIEKAGDTLMTIFKDPIQFFKNVGGGVKKGLKQFVKNIKKHLINGLIGWLTGSLSEVQITLPEKFDIKGIFSLVMQILGLTYTNIRARVVKKLGANGEQIVSTVEKSVEFVKELVVKGPIALWERVKQSLSDIKTTVMEGIRNWVIANIVKAGITWLIGMLNPAGAVVKAIKMLYDVVMFFVERFNQIVDFVTSIFNSVRELALGNIGKAANAVESAIGKSVPVIISFLAALIGLGGVGKAVKNIISKIQKPINKALDKVIGWIVDKGKALWGKGKGAVKKGKEKIKGLFQWWKVKKKFKTPNGESHSTYFSGDGKSAKIIIASTPKVLSAKIAELKADPKITTAAKAKIQLIEKQSDLIDGYKRDAVKKKDISMSKTIGKKIETALQQIANLLADPAFGGKELLPPSKVNWTTSALIKDKVGVVMTANPLSLSPGGNSGSVPSDESDIWTKVNNRKNAYVRGHLLNHHVHGPGVNKNLIPITGSLNTTMETQVETVTKNLVLGEKKVVNYQVRAKFTGHKKREHIKEEGLLPTALKFKIQVLKPKANRSGANAADWEYDSAETSKIKKYPKELRHTLPVDTPVGGVVTLHGVYRSDLLRACSLAGLNEVMTKALFTDYYIKKINKKAYTNAAAFVTDLKAMTWSKEGESYRDAFIDWIPIMVAAGKLKW